MLGSKSNWDGSFDLRNLNDSTLSTLDNCGCLLDRWVELSLRRDRRAPSFSSGSRNSGVIRRGIERDVEVCGESVILF